jgi:hypothetical protein
MLREARSYSDQVQLLLTANERSGADQVARAFQDVAEQRLRECLAGIKRDEKAQKRVAGQIGTPHAIDEVRELAAILRARDALGVVGSRLPGHDQQSCRRTTGKREGVARLPIGRHRDVFLYALLIVMSRLGSPGSSSASPFMRRRATSPTHIAATPFAIAVDVVLGDLDRIDHQPARRAEGGRQRRRSRPV